MGAVWGDYLLVLSVGMLACLSATLFKPQCFETDIFFRYFYFYQTLCASPSSKDF